MATSPGYVRLASIAPRPLTETVFDALREAVVVIDARFQHLPLVLVNTAARRCILGDGDARSLRDRSLYSFLGDDGNSAMEAALTALAVGAPSVERIVNWRFPGGQMPISTELKSLPSAPNQHTVMLTFAEPASEPALATAIEQLPHGMLILDRDLTVTYANSEALKPSGATAEALLGLSALGLLPASALPRDAFTRALQGNDFHDDAVVVALPGGDSRVYSVDVRPLVHDTAIVGLTVMTLDVTERRRRQGANEVSDPRFLALTENVRDIITVLARDGRVLYVNAGITHALGYTPGERHNHSFFDMVHPDDINRLRSQYVALASGRGDTFSEQYRTRHKDGSYRWLEARFVSALNNPLIKAIVVNSHDITQSKQAESQLAQREEVFRLTADAVSGVIFEWDLGRAIVHRSRGTYDVLGLYPESISTVGAWSERVHPLDRPGYDERIAAALRSGTGWTANYRIRDGRGRYRSMLERAIVQRGPGGEAIRAIGCAVDISESKRLADLLEEIQRSAMMGGWEYSYSAHELEWTDEMYSIFETTRDEFRASRGAVLERCTPESRQRLMAATTDAELASGSLDLEIEIITLKHRRVWVRVIGRVEMLDGQPFRAYGSMQNVQSRKLSQIAMETSTDWLKLSMNMAHMHAWRWERASDTLKFAIVDGQMIHLPRVFPGMRKLMTQVHPKDRLAVRRAIDHAFEHHVEVQEEFRLKSHDGQYRSYAAVARPVFDAANQPSGLVGVTQDVTIRRQAEGRLRRSEELLRATTANTADTLLLVDTDLKVRFINREVRNLSIEQILGEDIGVLLPTAARDNVVAKLRAVLATGETAAYDFEIETPGSALQYIENRAVLVRDDSIGTGVSIAMRDITERRRLEREVLEISSRERQRIGQDLHDGLGQELTGVALMLRGLAKRVQQESPDSVAAINEIVALVNQSIEAARSLARGLLPVSTGNGSLSNALEALARRCADAYGMAVDFRGEIDPQMSVGEDEASHIYRIAQEALTNTARHGHASVATVSIVLNPRQFLLRIADDGIGIDRPAGAAPGVGMGLRIMQYRASMIGARFQIVPNHPRGTVVIVTCEQPTLMNPLQSAQAV